MKLKSQFGEETSFTVPILKKIQIRTQWLSGPMHRPGSYTGLFGSHPCGITLKPRNAIRIPIGYQAETGFRLCVKPVE